MERTCEICGSAFDAKRADAKTCGPTCRSRKSLGGGQVRALPTKPPAASPATLTEAVRQELTAAGRETSALGASALVLAERIDSGAEPGSALSALNRELRATLADALRSAPNSVVGSLRDELAARRRA